MILSYPHYQFSFLFRYSKNDEIAKIVRLREVSIHRSFLLVPVPSIFPLMFLQFPWFYGEYLRMECSALGSMNERCDYEQKQQIQCILFHSRFLIQIWLNWNEVGLIWSISFTILQEKSSNWKIRREVHSLLYLSLFSFCITKPFKPRWCKLRWLEKMMKWLGRGWNFIPRIPETWKRR